MTAPACRLALSALALASIAPAAAPQAVDPQIKAVFPYVSAQDAAAFGKDGGHYRRDPTFDRRAGVPQGRVTAGTLVSSHVYPGMAHRYWLYVPAQYRAGTPAALMVFLDGSSYLDGEVAMPALLDNLIASGTIPPMLGLFTDAGDVGPGYPIYGGTGNRAVEYDSANGDLARFLLDELIPAATKGYRIAPDPAARAIMGRSSGGSAAFGVAWHRPDAFGKVLSTVGSFTAIRGADDYPRRVRQEGIRPIRVFLEDGTNDLDIVYGNWPLANRQMAAALAYRGYDVRFEMGENGHNDHHFAAIAADAMRWLWRPAPPSPNPTGKDRP